MSALTPHELLSLVNQARSAWRQCDGPGLAAALDSIARSATQKTTPHERLTESVKQAYVEAHDCRDMAGFEQTDECLYRLSIAVEGMFAFTPQQRDEAVRMRMDA